MIKPINTVGFETDEMLQQAQLLADELDYFVDKNAADCLYVNSGSLALKIKSFSLLRADFSLSSWNKRKSEGKKQGLVRACKPSPGIKIIDATAGWGKDSAILASFGAEVMMLERNTLMAHLLADALLHRADLDKKQMKISLHAVDAIFFLANLEPIQYPDVIYIDPMHPERTKSSLVKKEMQALQQLIGVDLDALELIECARKHVKQRVVVKWPQKNKALLPADLCIDGKTVRFDIYFPR